MLDVSRGGADVWEANHLHWTAVAMDIWQVDGVTHVLAVTEYNNGWHRIAACGAVARAREGDRHKTGNMLRVTCLFCLVRYNPLKWRMT
jgi:hypothetical protein